MRWAVQSTLINTQQAILVVDTLKRLNKTWVPADILPFSDTLIEPVEGNDLIPYGSTTLMKYAHKQGWKGLAFDPEQFKCSAWIRHRDMLNKDASIGSVNVIREYASNKARYAPDVKVFVRPDADLKLFNGMVTTFFELSEWLSNSETSQAKFCDDDAIVMASVKDIDAEWRFFVVNGNVVSGSMYRCEGRQSLERVTNKPILYQAQRLADAWLPHKNCVMDVALSDGGFKVLEFNCINASGFYDHDIELILTVLDNYYKDK